MKKKNIVISLSIGIGLVVLLFLFLLFTQPLFASKVFELCKVIDLRENLPSGNFQKVSIVPFFEVSADKMKEFEANFRKCVQSAIPLSGDPGVIPAMVLRIYTDNGKYVAYIDYNDKDVLVFGNFLHRSFRSKELRKVFYDAGLKYESEMMQPAQEKEANQP